MDRTLQPQKGEVSHAKEGLVMVVGPVLGVLAVGAYFALQETLEQAVQNNAWVEGVFRTIWCAFHGGQC